MLEGIVAGVISGLASPFVVSWLQHTYIWKSQKKLEMKRIVYDDAIRALNQYATDALDADLQALPSPGDWQRSVKTRPETDELMQRSRELVRVFFDKPAYQAYDAALRAPISISTVPNLEFNRARSEAVRALSADLGIL